MKNRTPAAFAACPESLSLPLVPPRDTWAECLDACARILREEDCGCAEQADDLHAIAAALRADCYGELIDALRDCSEAEQPMPQMHASRRAKAVLHRVGGGA